MKIEVSLRSSIFTCRSTEAEGECRMEEEKYVVRTHGCIFGHFNHTSQFFLLFLMLARMHARNLGSDRFLCVFLSNSVMVLMSISFADWLIESRRTKLNLLFN